MSCFVQLLIEVCGVSQYLDFKRFTLLVIDDDKSLLKFFKIHLGSQFSSVIVLNSPLEAEGVVRAHEVDIVLSDYEMPHFNGYELFQQIRACDPRIPFVLVTGADLGSSDEQTISSQVDGFLRKPFEVSDLSRVLDVCVDIRRQHLRDQAQKHQQNLSLKVKQHHSQNQKLRARRRLAQNTKKSVGT